MNREFDVMLVKDLESVVSDRLRHGVEGAFSVENDRYKIHVTITDKTKAKDYRDPVWLEENYVQQNRTMADIATEFGITPMAVNHWLTKHNIQTRPRGSKTQR